MKSERVIENLKITSIKYASSSIGDIDCNYILATWKENNQIKAKLAKMMFNRKETFYASFSSDISESEITKTAILETFSKAKLPITTDCVNTLQMFPINVNNPIEIMIASVFNHGDRKYLVVSWNEKFRSFAVLINLKTGETLSKDIANAGLNYTEYAIKEVFDEAFFYHYSESLIQSLDFVQLF